MGLDAQHAGDLTVTQYDNRVGRLLNQTGSAQDFRINFAISSRSVMGIDAYEPDYPPYSARHFWRWLVFTLPAKSAQSMVPGGRSHLLGCDHSDPRFPRMANMVLGLSPALVFND